MGQNYYSSEIFNNPYIVNFLTITIQIILTITFKKINNFFKSKNPVYNKALFLFEILSFSVIILVLTISLLKSRENYCIFVFLILTSIAIYTFSNYLKISQFWRIGIVGADSKTGEGFNYDTSLKICRHKLAFLGIGASKLTSSKEFENAILRCSQNETIKFLLLSPDADYLEHYAKRAEKDSNSYREKVLKSLKIISDIKKKRELDIKVRLYKIKPVFRLMFIDDSLCLVGSYAELGKDDGSTSPQLHIINDHNNKSLFELFESYFNQLWCSSEEYDLNQNY